jgi:RNA polymerase sigma factor (TIGR02999 family)
MGPNGLHTSSPDRTAAEKQRQMSATQLLLEWQGSNREVIDRLMPLVYDELRRLAHFHLRRERAGHTLQTTALVHEAYLNLIKQDRVDWQNRAHFFAIASRVMRRVLLMHARKKQALKRGGGHPHVPVDEVSVVSTENPEEVIALDDALSRLEALDDRLARVVECRHFGGLTVKETAVALDVSPATVKRDWRTAKAWLYRALGSTPQPK